ncbi:MAG: hypothetical protein FWG56_08805 [Desulfovibrionaceae bacterium]|jgi:hypothetical protein|nr:hypothetical protein [Desulfovibrionaceae bacterium]
MNANEKSFFDMDGKGKFNTIAIFNKAQERTCLTGIDGTLAAARCASAISALAQPAPPPVRRTSQEMETF